jgi:hypothetical protein
MSLFSEVLELASDSNADTKPRNQKCPMLKPGPGNTQEAW